MIWAHRGASPPIITVAGSQDYFDTAGSAKWGTSEALPMTSLKENETTSKRASLTKSL
jgi:hypothetical protein